MEHLKSIINEKPNINELIKDGYACFDMHIHTKYSDCFSRIQSVIKMARKKGLTGIAITDHNTIKGAESIWNEKKEILIIPGIEVGCFEGSHMLLYFHSLDELKEFYEKNIKNKVLKNPCLLTKVSIYDLIDKIKNYNCLLSAAHPFEKGCIGLYNSINNRRIGKDIIKKINTFEVICGENTKDANVNAIAEAIKLKKNFTAGSDAHSVREIGCAITAAKTQNIDAFLKSITKKENIVIGKETLLSRIETPIKAMTKFWRYPISSIKQKYREINL